MRVFLTGATGFVGSAILPELLSAGHQVLGYARSDEAAAKLIALGAEVQRGELTDIASLTKGAKSCDGVIHTAFIHDFSKFTENVEIDRLATIALVEALAGTGKPLITTSGLALLPPGRTATEADTPISPDLPRAAAEQIVISSATQGIRSAVVRLSPSVHGAGDHGFVPMLINTAREKGYAAYIGDGANLWPAVHRHDAAVLYRLVLDQAPAGLRWHGVAEEGVPMRDIARAIGQGLGISVKSLTEAEGEAYFTWFLRFASMNVSASSAATRNQLGWQPTGPGLLADISSAGYFS
jgi:nucleoside-diphosphate-sugar epimerase